MATTIDLGWANGWPTGPDGDDVQPEIVQKCRAAGHKTTDVDCGPPNRGLDHQVRCDTCGYVYHYDSSD